MKKIIYLLVGFILLCIIAGCGIEEPKNSKTNEVFPPHFSAVFKVNDTEHDMVEGGFTWEREKGADTEVVTTDALSPNQIAQTLEAVKLKPNQTIEIEIEKDPDLKLYLWDKEDRLGEKKLKDNQFSSSLSADRYIYEVIATWGNGERSYTFVVEVE